MEDAFARSIGEVTLTASFYFFFVFGFGLKKKKKDDYMCDFDFDDDVMGSLFLFLSFSEWDLLPSSSSR